MAQVFISYSKRDYIDEDGQVIGGSVVDRIIKTLSDNGISYWIDREGLDVGVTYADTISKSIKECDTFLFLSSQTANSSGMPTRWHYISLLSNTLTGLNSVRKNRSGGSFQESKAAAPVVSGSSKKKGFPSSLPEPCTPD